MPNALRGHVRVKDDGKGNLTLQLPSVYAQYYYSKKQMPISYGAKNTPANMRKAMDAAIELQSDLENDVFEPKNLTKYKHSSQRLGSYSHIEDISVVSLFKDFVNSKLIEPGTRRKYNTLINHLQKMNYQHSYTLKQQSEIDNWVRANMKESSVLKMLSTLYSAIEWGKKEEKISENFRNKFKEYEKRFKDSLHGHRAKRQPPKAVEHLPVREGIQAHSEECRDKIIAAFHRRNRQKCYRNKIDHLAYLIEFAFLTGCRHGEAFALVWKDIEYGKDKQGLPEVKIRIDESYDSQEGITKNTKTRKHRKTPADDRVVEILEILKPEHPDPNLLVFRNYQNNHFNNDAITHVWLPQTQVDSRTKKEAKDHSVIGKMIQDGELDYYMDAYSTRRTFISIQLNAGVPAHIVAAWVGDNVETIMKHYARPDDDCRPRNFKGA